MLIKLMILCFIMVFLCIGESIEISGYVKDAITGYPIQDAGVRLFQNSIISRTSSDGFFSLKGELASTSVKQQKLNDFHQFFKFDKSSIIFTLSKKEQISVYTYTPLGRLISEMHYTWQPGTHTFSSNVPVSGIYLQKIYIGDKSYIFKKTNLNKTSHYSGDFFGVIKKSESDLSRITSAGVFLDTLYVTGKNYYPAKMEVKSLRTTGLIINCKKQISNNQMRFIPAKDSSFRMGKSWLPEYIHKVSFSHDFYMDTTEITQEDYLKLMGVSPSHYDEYYPQCPVIYMTWFDAVLYCNARSKRDGFDTVYEYTAINSTDYGCKGLTELKIVYEKKGYRLPTEAEWEYASRAGTTTDFYWGKDLVPYPSTKSDSNEVNLYAWWENNYEDYSSESIHPDWGLHTVAKKLPNGFDLYDMSGNLWEWCNDLYQGYDTTDQIDPTGSIEVGAPRIGRGGGFCGSSGSLCSSSRAGTSPTDRTDFTGFRCVLPVW